MKRMYKILMPLVAIVALALPLNVAAQGTLTFDFENNVVPSDWTNNSANPWVVTNTSQGNGHSGTYCLKSGNSGVSSSTSAISATFTFFTDGSISFLGGIFGEGTSTVWDACKFKIDGVEQFSYGALGTWATYTYQVEAGTHTFEWSYTKDGSVNPTGDAFFIDSVVVQVGTNDGSYCYRVRDVVASAITTDGFTLSWLDTSNNSATYTVYNMADTTVLTTSTTTSCTISGLNANTVYNVAVVADCGTGTPSSYATISVRTACGAMNAPYTIYFDSVTGALPECWTAIATGTSGSGTFPSVYNYSNNSYSSPRYLEFESSNGATEILALPPMNNISSLGLTFYASVMNRNFVLEVGVLDDTTFEVVDTINLIVGNGNWHDSYYRYNVFFANYSGNGDRIALRVTGTANSSYTLMMDNFSVQEFSGCYPVTNFSISNVGSTEVTLDWDDNFNNGASYNVYYWTSPTDTLVEITTADSVTITGLSINTVYNFAVEADCGSGNVSTRTVTISTRTLAGDPINQFPYTCGFEIVVDDNGDTINEGAIWVTENNSPNGWYTGTAAYHTGSRGLYISNNSTGNTNAYTNNTGCVSYAHATFNMTAGEYVLSFDWKANGESSWDFLRVAYAPYGTSLPTSYSNWGSSATAPTGFISLDDGQLSLQTTWQTKTTTFTVANSGLYDLYFVWRNDGSSGSNPPAAIDNVQLLRNTCPAPTNFVADSIGPYDVTFHWNHGGEETEWVIRAIHGNVTDAWQTCTDTFYTYTGLSSETNYTFQLRAVCGADDSSLIVTRTATTLITCEAPTNFTANVHGDTATFNWRGAIGSNWVLVYGTAGLDPDTVSNPINLTDTTYDITLTDTGFYDAYVLTNCGGDSSRWEGPVTFSYGVDVMNMATTGSDTLRSCAAIIYDNGGPTGSYTTNCNATLVLLPTNLNDMVRISGQSQTEGSYDYLTIYEGIGTTGTILFQDNQSGNDNTIPFGPFTGDAFTVVFYSDGSVVKDGFMINVSCIAGSDCVRPRDVVVNALHADSVVVSWNTIDNTATSWEIALGAPGFNPDTVSSPIAVTDSSYVFTNLAGGTAYEVYVRTDCGNEQSLWVGPVRFIPGSFNMGTIGSSTISMCSGVIYDNGGSNGDYGYNVNYTLTVYPTSADSMLAFHGTFEYDGGYDHLYIYEGVGTNGTILWQDDESGYEAIPLDTCTSGPITIQLTSDEYEVYAGLELFVNCVAAPDCSPVANLESHVTPTAALITWEPGYYGHYTGATVEYKADTATDWTSAGTVTGNFIVIDGLDAVTDYNVRVTTNCDGFAGGIALANFTTADYECAVIDTASTFNITLANGSTTNSNIPSYSLYEYSMSQQIFTAAEINHGGTISSVAFNASSIATPNRTIEIYMGHTTSASASTFLNPTDMTMVYSGAVTLVAGWNTFELTTPFNYDGVQNLLITVRDMTGSWSSSNSWLGSNSSTSGVSVYAYRDGTPYNIGDNTGYAGTFRCGTIIAGSNCLQQATCAAPAAAVIDVTTTTITLAWAPGAGDTSWNVYYRLAGTTAWSTPVSVTANSYTFSGLNSGRNYEFKVENVCTEGSFSAIVEAATLCAAITLPFAEDFNGWGNGGIPNCWYNTGSYSSTGVISSTQNMTGATGGSILMFSSSSASNISRIILPELDTNVNQMNQAQLVFNAKYTSDTYTPTYVIGVMTDPNNVTTFAPVDTVTTTGGANQWEVLEVPMANYTGHGTYAAIQTLYTGNYSESYIDNIILELIPTCPRPDSLTVSNASTSSIDVSWRERGNATSWVVEWGPMGFALGTGTVVSAPTNPFTLTGLPSSFHGEYYVRSVCSSTDTGNYSYRPCAFNTTQIPATLPYSYDFEDPAEWANWQTCSNNSNNWFRGTAVADSGSYSLYMSADSGATYKPYLHNSAVNATAYRDIDFGPIDSSYTFTFRARAGGTTTSSVDGMIVLLADPSIATMPSDDPLMTPWGDVRRLYQIIDVRTDTTWQTYTASFDTIHGVQRVAFYWFNQNTEGNSSYPNLGEPVAMDNLHIEYSSCPRPLNLAATTGTTTATITWDGDNANYEVKYRKVGDTVNTDATSNTNSIILSNLTSTSDYYFWVRKVCGAGDTSLWSDRLTFTTQYCDGGSSAFSYTNAMGTTTNQYTPIGYSYYNNSFVQTIIDSAQLATLNGPINQMAFYPTVTAGGDAFNGMNVYLSNVSESNLTSGFIHADANHQFVHVVANRSFNYTTTGWQYQSFDTTFTWDGHSNVLVTVTRQNGTYVSGSTFRAHSAATNKTRYYYDDNTSYTITNATGGTPSNVVGDLMLLSCPAGVTCEAPVITDVTASDDNATMTWTSTHDSCYVAITDGDWNNAVAGTLVITGIYTFGNLTPNTNYTVGVRQRCDEGIYSDWTIQNLTTTDVPCLAVTGLAIVETGFDHVTVNWTPASVETAWNVRIYNTTMDTTVRSTDTVCTVGSLIRGVTYNVSVQPLCGSGATIEGPWCEAISFTTDECQPVTDVTVSNITGTSVKLGWTAASSSDNQWRIEYGYAGFSRGEGHPVTATTNPYTLTGLERNTAYDVYVATDCGDNRLSSWSPVASFTTNNTEGIDEVTDGSAVSLYPNPATSTVTVDLTTMGLAEVSVIDMNGRESGKWQAVEGSLTIDVSQMAKGAYFVRVTGDQATVVRKLIVK